MNNYRNYGNRRVSGEEANCGYNGNNYGNGRAMNRNYGRADVRQGMDCGCDKKDVKGEVDCAGDRNKENNGADCGCSIESMYREVKKNGICSTCEEDMPGKALAMAYVPWQTWENLYEICEGFSAGTIFKDLNLEFYGRRCN